MKKLASLFIIVALLGPKSFAQNPSDNTGFLDRTTFKISTDFIDNPADPNSFWVPSELFNTQPTIGLGMDYALTDHFIIGSAFTYSGSSSESIGILDYFVRPEDDAVYAIKSSDTFRNLTFDPKAKLQFYLNNFGFFWSAGPIVSVASLSSETQNSTFEDPKHFTSTSQNTSRSIGFGGQASTGMHFFFSKHIGVSAEIGYKYLQHNSLQAKHEFSEERRPVNYELNTMFHRAGLIFKF